jgi:hypothetical protein
LENASINRARIVKLIPDPTNLDTVGAGTSASGIAADAMRNVYAADVGAHREEIPPAALSDGVSCETAKGNRDGGPQRRCRPAPAAAGF